MAYTRYTTFIAGYNTAEANPHQYASLSGAEFAAAFEASEAWMKEHYIQIHHTGVCKPKTVRAIAARKGIVHGLKAEAVSFDQSGKGCHSTKPIAL